MTPAEFFAKWGNERTRLGKYRQLADPIPLIDDILTDARSAFEHRELEVLTLRHASEESGYSVDHLARLIRESTIPNAGRPGAPRILRRDLPTKPPRSVARPRSCTYDPLADARKLVGRREGGT